MSQRGKLTSVSYSPVRTHYSCQEKSALLSSWESHLFIWIQELQAAGTVHRLHTGLANGESLKTVLNWHKKTHRGYLQFSWVSQSCLTFYSRMDCSKPCLPVHHQLLELAHTHVHRVRDAITISSSAVPLFSRLQSFPESGSFLMSQFFASDGQSIGASASVLPMNDQDWFPSGWTCWILQSKGLSRVFSNTTVQKHQFFCTQLSL